MMEDEVSGLWVDLIAVHFLSCCYCASTPYEALDSVVTIMLSNLCHQPDTPGLMLDTSLLIDKC